MPEEIKQLYGHGMPCPNEAVPQHFLDLTHIDQNTKARRGILKTTHGTIETPFFMPVATNAAVKALAHENILDMGAQIILSNTYHLFLRPGMDIIQKSGGLHTFMR